MLLALVGKESPRVGWLVLADPGAGDWVGRSPVLLGAWLRPWLGEAKGSLPCPGWPAGGLAAVVTGANRNMITITKNNQNNTTQSAQSR